MQPRKANGRDMNILFLRQHMHVKIWVSRTDFNGSVGVKYMEYNSAIEA